VNFLLGLLFDSEDGGEIFFNGLHGVAFQMTELFKRKICFECGGIWCFDNFKGETQYEKAENYSQDYCFFFGLFHRPKKPVILCVIHHRQNPSESTENYCILAHSEQ
jgi:hypothetical protein